MPVKKIKKNRNAENRKAKARRKYTPRDILSAIVRYFAALSVILVLALILAFLLLPQGDTVSVPINAIGSILTPVQSAVTNATSTVRGFFAERKTYSEMQEEYDRIVRENLQLTLQLNEASEALAENDTLRSLLDAKEAYDTLDPVYAKIVAREKSQWFNTFTIDKGTTAGLKKDMAVVNADGLIGRIYEIGLNYAKVISVIDTRSGLGCLIQRTRDNGIMRGGVKGTTDVAECYVYYLPNVNNIIPGDTVITSGTDSKYPKGLIIGTVSEISVDSGSEGSYAVVHPAVDFQHLEEVLVLREVVEQYESSGALEPTLTASPNPSPSPSPTPDPAATPTIDPEIGEANWIWPDDVAGTNVTADVIEMLPEDKWADR